MDFLKGPNKLSARANARLIHHCLPKLSSVRLHIRPIANGIEPVILFRAMCEMDLRTKRDFVRSTK